MDHPVKLVVTDDLERTRASVFFRLLLAIPHFVWLYLWGFAAFLIAILSWFVTLASGTPWEGAHAFVSRYVRYTVHVYAYVALLANPYPRFGGDAGYPVDVELPGPERQSRWKVAFRLLLALPAGALAGMLTTGYWNPGSSDLEYFELSGGLLTAVALLGWFAVLARGRMPRGLRDAGAYAVLYNAQLWAYLLLLTDRYPNSDPLAAAPVVLDLELDRVLAGRRRRRLATFFRLLLAIPHFAWLTIWGIAAFAAAIASWCVQLVAGRPHAGFHRFLATYLRYVTHVYAYVYLVAEPYPEFDGRTGAYPVELSVASPERQSRWTVAFRLLLAVPAFLVAGAYAGVAVVAAVLGWFAVLARGEMPLGLRNTLALFLRYNQQLLGYVLLLTERYPYSGPTAPSGAVELEQPVFLPPDALATT